MIRHLPEISIAPLSLILDCPKVGQFDSRLQHRLNQQHCSKTECLTTSPVPQHNTVPSPVKEGVTHELHMAARSLKIGLKMVGLTSEVTGQTLFFQALMNPETELVIILWSVLNEKRSNVRRDLVSNTLLEHCRKLPDISLTVFLFTARPKFLDKIHSNQPFRDIVLTLYNVLSHTIN